MTSLETVVNDLRSRSGHSQERPRQGREGSLTRELAVAAGGSPQVAPVAQQLDLGPVRRDTYLVEEAGHYPISMTEGVDAPAADPPPSCRFSPVQVSEIPPPDAFSAESAAPTRPRSLAGRQSLGCPLPEI
jgi:hypothetical protein